MRVLWRFRWRCHYYGLVSPFREYSFVQVHTDSVLRFDVTVKYTLHVSVCPCKIIKLVLFLLCQYLSVTSHGVRD